MGYGSSAQLSSGFSANIAADCLLPNPCSYDFAATTTATAMAAAAAMKSDSGITTYNVNPLPRKRGRERDHQPMITRLYSNHNSSSAPTTLKNSSSFYFLGEDFSFHTQQHQFDLDQFISLHMEKVRMEVEEKRKKQGRRMMEEIEMGMMKILRKKEEEIENIGKLNWELEERVNSLCMENQIWRDVAQTNEATAVALRTNLDQLLSHLKNDVVADDPTTSAAESCCGSNGGDDGWRYLEVESKRGRMTMGNDDKNGGGGGDRRCKNCWKEDSCVLLLPCRHLCLCTVCGSSLLTCPICNSTNNASVRVIMP